MPTWDPVMMPDRNIFILLSDSSKRALGGAKRLPLRVRGVQLLPRLLVLAPQFANPLRLQGLACQSQLLAQDRQPLLELGDALLSAEHLRFGGAGSACVRRISLPLARRDGWLLRLHAAGAAPRSSR